MNFSIRTLIDFRSNETPELDFLLMPGNAPPLLFHEPKSVCSKIFSALNNESVGSGKVVAMTLPNGKSSVVLVLFVMYSGRILCPLNLAAGDEQLSYVLEHSESSLLVIGKNFV